MCFVWKNEKMGKELRWAATKVTDIRPLTELGGAQSVPTTIDVVLTCSQLVAVVDKGNHHYGFLSLSDSHIRVNFLLFRLPYPGTTTAGHYMPWCLSPTSSSSLPIETEFSLSPFFSASLGLYFY